MSKQMDANITSPQFHAAICVTFDLIHWRAPGGHSLCHLIKKKEHELHVCHLPLRWSLKCEREDMDSDTNAQLCGWVWGDETTWNWRESLTLPRCRTWCQRTLCLMEKTKRRMSWGDWNNSSETLRDLTVLSLHRQLPRGRNTHHRTKLLA